MMRGLPVRLLISRGDYSCSQLSMGLALALLLSSSPAFAARELLSPGLQIAVRLDTTISTKDQFHYFGPVLTTTLDQDIMSADGRVAVPAGATVKIAMSDFHRAGRVSGRARLRLRLYSVVMPDGSEVPLDGYPSSVGNISKPDKEGTFHGRRGLVKDAAFDLAAVATGAGAGLIVGGPWGLPAGAAGGLIAAGIWTVARRGPDIEIPAGTVISFTLGRPASVWVSDRSLQESAIVSGPMTSSMTNPMPSSVTSPTISPCAAWGCNTVAPPSRDLLALLDSPADPQVTLQQVEHVNYRERPDTDRVFVAYIRGVSELRLSHPTKAFEDLKEAYVGAKSLGLPASAQAEIARNLLLALQESSRNWEQSPLMRDPNLQAALVQPALGLQ
jgi:hypothetical protein